MNKDMNEFVIARAKRYKEYIAGMAYIPYQDLPIYRQAFNQVYNN